MTRTRIDSGRPEMVNWRRVVRLDELAVGERDGEFEGGRALLVRASRGSQS